jgi:hypothetical protein
MHTPQIFVVPAKPPGRANARPMTEVARFFRHCERSEAIQKAKKVLDCFVASLLAMTGKSDHHFPRHPAAIHFEFEIDHGWPRKVPGQAGSRARPTTEVARFFRHCERGEAIQEAKKYWIASSLRSSQ